MAKSKTKNPKSEIICILCDAPAADALADFPLCERHRNALDAPDE